MQIWSRVRRFQRISILILVMVVAALPWLMAAPVGDKSPTKAASTEWQGRLVEQPPHNPELTPADLEAFFDGLVPQQLSREDIAGTAIVVVKNGQVLFSKGYGYADVAKKTPVSPETTLFRPGSVSKLFTWTAVMQQVERGKLDLDRDVNDYLDFKIPSKYSKPITLRNLMTHSGGFEESLLQLWAKDAADVKPIGDYLKERIPRRIYAPGTVPAYSNYGTTLAGYLVERTSGQRFDDYVEQNIFKPLGMTHSTFRQPLPESLKSSSPVGYSLASRPGHGFEFIQVIPAGASTVNANDMAKFMIAHLQDGRYEGVQILKPDTVQLMHSRQLENHPDMNAMALGFYETSRNGHRIIGHNGETQYFQSAVRLIPDAGIGFFITQNSFGKGDISFRNVVWDKFLNRYFPPSLPQLLPSAGIPNDAKEVVGSYISSRRYESTVFSVLSLLSSWKVVRNSDGTISVNTLKETSGQVKKFQETGPLVFRNVNGEDKLAFKRGDSGRMEMVIDVPFETFQKSPWYHAAGFNLTVIVTCAVVFLLTLLLWPVTALIRRHYGNQLHLDSRQRRLRMLTKLVCVVDLMFLIGMILVFQYWLSDYSHLSPRSSPLLHSVQLLGWLGVVGSIVAIYNAVKSWTDKSRWLWSRAGDSVIALSSIGFVWFVFTWHMLSWTLN